MSKNEKNQFPVKRFIYRLEVKFVLIATIIILSGAAIINYVIYSFESKEHYKLVTNQVKLGNTIMSDVLKSYIKSIPDGYESTYPILINGFLNQFPRRESNLNWGVFVFNKEQGHTFTFGDSTIRAVQCPIFPREKGSSKIRFFTFRDQDRKNVLISLTPLSIGSTAWHTLAVLSFYNETTGGLQDLLRQLIIISIIAVLVSIAIAVIVARALARPIKVLASEMNLVEAPYYRTELLKNRNDEIGVLQQRFLNMLDRLRDSEGENRYAQKALIHTERMASIGTIVSGLAHDINNPLAGLKQSMNRIINDPQNVTQTKKYGTLIFSALSHIEKVVRRLLDFSKKQEINFEIVNINDILDDSIRLVEYEFKNKHISLVKDFQEKTRPVLGNIQYLNQVFINILLNAIQATEKHGKIVVKTFSDNENNMIEIEDTGTGISKINLEKIFNPFFTTKGKQEGTGLGLSICSTIIRDHGGKITASSKVGVGTIIAVILPHAGKI